MNSHEAGRTSQKKYQLQRGRRYEDRYKNRKISSNIPKTIHKRKIKELRDELNIMETTRNMASTTSSNDLFSLDIVPINSNVSYNITETAYPVLAYQSYIESAIAWGLLKYLTPIIVIVGTIGNMLSFAVLLRKPMRGTSVYVYLAALAWADTAVLYLSAFKTWIRIMTGWELLHVSEAGCKILMHLFVVSLHMAAWLIVAMSVDRLIAVLMPFRAVSWCSTFRARIISLIMLIIFYMIHLHILWKFRLEEEHGHYQCAGGSFDYFIVEVFPWLRLVTYSIIPFCIVLILNVIIISKLIKERPEVQQTDGNIFNTQRMMIQQRKLTVMLLSVSFVWLGLSSPFTIWRLVYPGIATKDQHHRARVFLARTICFNIMWLNHAVNFLLYCLTGKKFRRELMALFSAIAGRQRAVRRHSTRTIRTWMRKTSSGLLMEHNPNPNHREPTMTSKNS